MSDKFHAYAGQVVTDCHMATISARGLFFLTHLICGLVGGGLNILLMLSSLVLHRKAPVIASILESR